MSSHGVIRTARDRTDLQRREATEKIRFYRSLVDQLRSKPHYAATIQHLDHDHFAISTEILLMNPEYYTIWNIRRRCIAHTMLSTSTDPTAACENDAQRDRTTIHDITTVLNSELDFTENLMREHAKCYWIWKYRSWILNQARDRLPREVARSIWEQELTLISKLLHRDRRNFHAWAFRRHIVTELERSALQGSSLVETEFEYTTKMIRLDLSNFSAWHSRIQLIPRLLLERESGNDIRKKFLEAEFSFVRKALNVGPDDQSLWYYHKFLMYELVGPSNNHAFVPELHMMDRKILALTEIDNIRELAVDYADVKWIWEALIEYTAAIVELEDRPLNCQEGTDIRSWLGTLRNLDPKRNGRWNFIKVKYDL
ncbi:geranylgeranyl transferase type-2 subunit beta [Ophiocordyceps camponoti-floridani]|uniref:Geranylgeranyl transferase type-2 subunit alpha n=1 Tax=Ophiocordyceps camponoti-floridani TaxID=2030778 RepID=A0A8H4Q4C0_9HYPO|nr:geranylgeranyl transferase type-2 subunit beta [Ophiocordyceps camponoti-floridani]